MEETSDLGFPLLYVDVIFVPLSTLLLHQLSIFFSKSILVTCLLGNRFLSFLNSYYKFTGLSETAVKC